MNNRNFENILNACIERLLKGETIERCLADYPAESKELEPLLKTFAAARTAAQVAPRAKFKAQAKYEFQMALAKMSEAKRNAPAKGWSWRWQSAWSIAIMAVLFVIVAGAGTVFAAGRSMPDSPLYSIKLASENVQLALTPSGLGKAELNAQIADRRVAEIRYMAQKGNAQEVVIVAQRLNSNLQNIASLAGVNPSNQERATGAAPSNAFGAPSKSSGGSDNSQAAMATAPSMAPAVPSPAQPPLALAPTTTPAPVTTAAPTTTATATNTATVAAGPPPSVITRPAPTTTSSGAATTLPAVSLPPQNANAVQSTAVESEKVKIARVLVESAQRELDALNGILASASNEVRPAIRQAIAQAQAELDKALAILQEALASGQ